MISRPTTFFLLGAVAIIIAVGAIWFGVSRYKGIKNSPPVITLETTSDQVVVKKNNKTFAALARNMWPAGELKVVGQSVEYVYIAVNPEIPAGYLLFDPGVYKVEQLNLNNPSDIKDVSRGEAAFVAAAPDGSAVAYAEYGPPNKVIIRDTISGKEIVDTPPAHYLQFGSMHFSPDGSKLAYAAATGFPGKESGAVFTVEVKTGVQRLVAITKEPDTYFVVNGWKDNNSVDYIIGGNRNTE